VSIVSYRLGGNDGVSIEAAKWADAFRQLGAGVETVAGSGAADRLVPGLAADADGPLDVDALAAALDRSDLVVVENCCALPLNRGAGEALARLLAGRPAILRHHDLPWQRTGMGDSRPPHDPAWRHVTINERSRLELQARGIPAVTMYNSFDPDVSPGEREATRRLLGVGENEVLVLQPTRAIPRKNVPGGVLFARGLGATYWLLGPAEDGYGPQLERILRRAAATGGRVLRGLPEGRSIEDAYAACDVVVLPSTFEGFGNPSVESALHRRPLAIGPYPVAKELLRFGFKWFDAAVPLEAAEEAAAFLAAPDERLIEHNERVARMRFSTRDLPARLRALLSDR
jgi:mannosylglucosylglycerate synthase